MIRALTVRARVEVGSEDPSGRLFDKLTDAVVRSGPFARARFATAWSDTDGLKALADGKRRALAPSLAAELRDYHLRLGASPATMAALERLVSGEAVCAVAGQQPAPLGGPLYALHKIAATAGLAARVVARTRRPCVPLHWTHVEDSDFAEIRTVTVGDAHLTLHDLTLPSTAHVEGGLVGAIPIEPVAALGSAALVRWEGLPGHSDVERLWRQSMAGARDLGELQSALMLGLFGDCGLVVVDPRLPSFRAAARAIIDRYLDRADELSALARRAGAAVEPTLGRRPLADVALDSFVFRIEDGVRHKISAPEARRLPAGCVLSASVALRPMIQDGVFPTVAMACGPGELAYLAQLREVFDALDVRPACPVPRFGATWLPPAAMTLLEASESEPWELIAASDGVLRRLAEQHVPSEVRAALDRARTEAMDSLQRFAGLSARVDPSLPQLVESARGKVEYQFTRMLEGLTGKARNRLEREHPDWVRLRYYLSPGDRLQERRLASLEPIAYRGRETPAELCELAQEHAAALEEGQCRHYVVEL